MTRLLLLIVLSVLFSKATAYAGQIAVVYDQSTLLKLSMPVQSVIVGNPSIAHVAIRSAELLVITGKSFGTTNLIALDAAGKVAEQTRIVVVPDRRNSVNVFRGAARSSYVCTPHCRPALVAGDEPDFFAAQAESLQKKANVSSTATNRSGAID